MARESLGFVYFIQSEAIGSIKIGHSRDPNKRLADLRLGTADLLKPLGIMSGSVWHERNLHRRFVLLRTHGEWFKPGDTLLDYIAKRARPWPAGERMLLRYEEIAAKRHKTERDDLLVWAKLELRLERRAKIKARRKMYQG